MFFLIYNKKYLKNQTCNFADALLPINWKNYYCDECLDRKIVVDEIVLGEIEK